MFDVAYEAEATIAAAEMEKEKIWEKILNMDLSKPLAGFAEMLDIHYCDLLIIYWSIMYGTHGV